MKLLSSNRVHAHLTKNTYLPNNGVKYNIFQVKDDDKYLK